MGRRYYKLFHNLSPTIFDKAAYQEKREIGLAVKIRLELLRSFDFS